MIKGFSHRLYQLLTIELPGVVAHRVMAPVTRPLKAFDLTDYPDAKVAAVMILLYPKQDTVYLALIKRPDYGGVHSGQVSFPGGKSEDSDTDYQFTALRETEEEIGVKASLIQVIGQLSNVYIPPSNFFVFPFVGLLDHSPQFLPDVNEVEYIIEVPVNLLLDPAIKSTVKINRPEVSFDAPCYLINGHTVWGATAIILSEFEFLLKQMND